VSDKTKQEIKDRLIEQLLVVRSYLDDAYNAGSPDDELIEKLKQIQTHLTKSIECIRKENK
jgi:hypothetical protein